MRAERIAPGQLKTQVAELSEDWATSPLGNDIKHSINETQAELARLRAENERLKAEGMKDNRAWQMRVIGLEARLAVKDAALDELETFLLHADPAEKCDKMASKAREAMNSEEGSLYQ